ncbi:Uncharacterised protein [Streptococcus pneumoniae]|uniref:Uncharacterized protein n=1 Tax=Streptococcus pneumoniae TaxID=1313 RepID=A0AA87C6X6_STREE|nr:Uncharacterised protein [Streptococcus pneumoniae]CIS63228.1 Uncharacterised protein [Streptococcus pneumoniae]CIZ06984.1 Uncharacterised protein [Streptococcus pneumoniae]CJV47433.1 Uncharacterised protein [Streptococcus pneumoniae]CJW78320.1 Uncharacterised protein [Streptococcus pneumoniae]
MIILRNRQLIKNDFIEEINTFQTIISEKQNNFEMNLHLSFPQKGKLYKLGKHDPDNNGMNTLFSQKFCDGIILWFVDNIVSVYIIELKKTATSYLEKIPVQFHISVLRALSDIAIISSPLNYKKEPNRNFKIQYNFIIGTVEEKSLSSEIDGPFKYKNLPGYPSNLSDKLENYYRNIVFYNYDDIGNKVIFEFEKFIFDKVTQQQNHSIYKYSQEIPWIAVTKSMSL